MRFSVPQKLQKLYFLSVLLFLLHVGEEYVTLYYPTLFGITYRMHGFAQIEFFTIETTVITTMVTAAYLLKKQLIPFPFMILPGLFYLYQCEHIENTIKIHTYYPGSVTGMILVVLGLIYWKNLFQTLAKRKNLFP